MRVGYYDMSKMQHISVNLIRMQKLLQHKI